MAVARIVGNNIIINDELFSMHYLSRKQFRRKATINNTKLELKRVNMKNEINQIMHDVNKTTIPKKLKTKEVEEEENSQGDSLFSFNRNCRSKSEYIRRSKTKLPKIANISKCTNEIKECNDCEQDSCDMPATNTDPKNKSVLYRTATKFGFSSPHKTLRRDKTSNDLFKKFDSISHQRLKEMLKANYTKRSQETNRQRNNVLKIISKSKINSKKAMFGKSPPRKVEDITYTRDSLEKLAGINSMRYFDSYHQFLHEYHQTIIAGLIGPSDGLKYRINVEL